jgi:large repetitive protein
MKIKIHENRRRSAWMTFIIVLSLCPSLFGQTTDNSIRVGGITATRFYMGRLDEGGQNEFRYRLSYNRDLSDPANPNCVQFSLGTTGWFEYFDGVNFYDSFGEIIDNPFTTYTQLQAEMWENDGGDECLYDSGDDMHCGPDLLSFRYIDYPPGIENTIVWDVCTNNPFSIEYKFRYGLPKPTVPYSGDNGALICDNSDRTLTTVTGISGGFDQPWNYRFETVWEYQAGSGPWTQFGIAPVFADFSAPSPKSIITLPLRTLFNGITAITTINYRVKTRMTVVGGPIEPGSVFESVYNYPAQPLSLAPAAPTIGTTSVTPSCASSATGTVTVNATGLGEYLYVLRTGNNTTPCDPEVGTCGTGPSGRVTSNTFTINNVAAGDYTLLVANKGGATGVCWNYKYITVGKYASLHSIATSGDVSCFGASDGFINLAATGGKAPLSFRVTGPGIDRTSASGSFDDLPAGSFNASVTDACGSVLTTPVTIGAPAELKATFLNTNASCTSNGNGKFSATVTQGGGRYTFQLYKNGGMFRAFTGTIQTSWAHNDLTTGTYTIRIYDLNVSPTCFISSTINITQPPAFTLPAANIIVTDVSCNGTKGKIVLVNESSAGMLYELVNTQTNEIIQPNIDLEFLSLLAGRYKVVKKRNDAGCNDRVESAELTVAGAGAVTIAISKTDVTCFDASNGTIAATVSGGSPDDVYKWEMNVGGSWTGLPMTGSTVTGLAGGVYRLTITTPDLCGAVSDEIEIVEPTQLVISEIEVTDVSCTGGVGRVRANVTGGVAPYTYIYTSGGVETVVSTDEAELAPGIYSLRITDVGGCEVIHDEEIVLGSKGGPINIELISTSNVKCSGDRNGEIVVSTSGGSAPFTYSLNGIASDKGPVFSSLDPGTYLVRVQDKFGCANSVAATVELLSAPISLTMLKEEPSCFGARDGSIEANVSGGVAPFMFQWENNNSQSSKLSSIAAGTYSLRITDQQGCVLNETIDVAQPSEVKMTVKSIPVCSGQPTGEIDIQVEGGTLPYEYSISGNDYVSISKFTNVPAGSYTVRVRDAGQCSASSTVQIVEQNSKPQVDFIVASKESAQDTLVVHEISIPKPDRVEWQFDPAIIILGREESSAQIKVMEPGSYPITMTGIYGGCLYSKTSTLVFDPYDPESSHRLNASDLVIKKMELNPNPTSGPFNLLVELAGKQSIAVTVYDLVGAVQYRKIWEKENGLNESLELASSLPVGIYIVRVVTNTDARQLQLVLAR